MYTSNTIDYLFVIEHNTSLGYGMLITKMLNVKHKYLLCGERKEIISVNLAYGQNNTDMQNSTVLHSQEPIIYKL